MKWEEFIYTVYIYMYFALHKKTPQNSTQSMTACYWRTKCNVKDGWMMDCLNYSLESASFLFVALIAISIMSSKRLCWILHLFRRKKHTSLEEWATISASVQAEITSHGQMQGYWWLQLPSVGIQRGYFVSRRQSWRYRGQAREISDFKAIKQQRFQRVVACGFVW